MINKSIALLGLKAKDRITGFSGVISSITFDLYGCVQAVITPEIGKDGKTGESCWFDIKRLDTGKRVMEVPGFAAVKFGKEIGSAERPRTMPR
jgi:hypothetical protein